MLIQPTPPTDARLPFGRVWLAALVLLVSGVPAWPADLATILAGTAVQPPAEIGFREERLAIRKDLRDVRRNLRKDIDALDTWLKFVNIALIPILIGVGGLIAGLWQMRRRKSAIAAAAG